MEIVFGTEAMFVRDEERNTVMSLAARVGRFLESVRDTTTD